MPDTPATLKPAAGRAEQHSTRLLFLLAGFAAAAWASLVPVAKAATGVNEGQLGLVLLCLGIGSLLAMPVSGVVSTRHGCRKVLMVCGAALCACLPLLASVQNVFTLAAALFFFGAMIGTFDCVMNIQAVIVERDSKRPLMSGFHGFYSLGGLLGAATTSTIMDLGVSPFATVSAIALAGVLLLMVIRRHVLPYGNPAEGPPFALPRGEVLFLGMLCMTVFLVEGSMMDWSAVMLTENHGMPVAQAGYGFAAFSLTMTFGRLTGDRIVARVGRRSVVTVGGLLAMGRHPAGHAGSPLAGGIAGLRHGGAGLLQHRAGAVHGGGAPDQHAAECGGPGHVHARLCRGPGRAGRHRLHRTPQQPAHGLPAGSGADAVRGHQRALPEALTVKR